MSRISDKKLAKLLRKLSQSVKARISPDVVELDCKTDAQRVDALREHCDHLRKLMKRERAECDAERLSIKKSEEVVQRREVDVAIREVTLSSSCEKLLLEFIIQRLGRRAGEEARFFVKTHPWSDA